MTAGEWDRAVRELCGVIERADGHFTEGEREFWLARLAAAASPDPVP